MSELTVITNHVPRDVIDGWELDASEREEFDYIDWQAVDRGEDSASFVRYRGELYDLGDFTTLADGASGLPSEWHGVTADTFFSGTLVRFADDNCETVVMGRYYA